MQTKKQQILDSICNRIEAEQDEPEKAVLINFYLYGRWNTCRWYIDGRNPSIQAELAYNQALRKKKAK